MGKRTKKAANNTEISDDKIPRLFIPACPELVGEAETDPNYGIITTVKLFCL